MNRYKFRAWLKQEKKMVEVEEINFIYEEVRFKDYKTPFTKPVEINVSFDDIELMQYTGRQDKNEIEIYEGDIVKVDYLQEKIFEIIFVNGGFKLKAKDCSTEYDYSITSTMIEENAIEVIGNIYENKELLEDE